jgi:hypothetical protein
MQDNNKNWKDRLSVSQQGEYKGPPLTPYQQMVERLVYAMIVITLLGIFLKVLVL